MKYGGHIFRRFSIGAGLGLITALTLSIFINLNFNYAPPSMDFDHEIIAIEHSETTSESHHIKNDSVTVENANGSPLSLNENAGRYPYFSKHKNDLTAAQMRAIADNTPRLSLIVNQSGQSRNMNELVREKLPKDTTISISPYVQNFNETAGIIHNDGFETWMDLSALTLDRNVDHGELALSPTYNLERNLQLLSSQLDNKDYVTGVILPLQSIITETPSLWADIVTDLFADGFGIIDNTIGITKPALYFYDDHRAPYIKGDQYIDTTVLKLDEFTTVLNESLDKIRRDNNFTLTVTISTPAHLDILTRWLDSLSQQNIILLPASAQARL